MKYFYVILISLLLLGCSPRSQAWNEGASFKWHMGDIPSDVCYIDGIPQILGVSADEGSIHVAYIRNNGDVVMHNYYMYGSSMKDGGEFFWSNENVNCRN